MFCKSRESWGNMPRGLIQTVLCDEKLATDYSRIDELFYHAMQATVDGINDSTEVAAPVDNGRALVARDVDCQRMNNWKNRLESNLKEFNRRNFLRTKVNFCRFYAWQFDFSFSALTLHSDLWST